MMDRQMTRLVASIFLVIAVILIGIKSFQPKSEAAAPPKKGYIEIKKEEYRLLEQEAEQWRQKYEELDKERNKEKNSASAKDDKPAVKVLHLNINDGMTSKEVSRKMEKAGIIKNANEFNDYLAGKKWQQSIQIGDYELTSDMGLQEIAETITGNRSKKE